MADRIENWRDKLKEWPYSKQVMLPHLGEAREAPHPGEIFRQPDLAATLRKLVEAEAEALKAGKSRKEAIQAAYDRFYRGDIAEEFVRSVKEQGGLITLADLDRWRPLDRGAAHHELPRRGRVQARHLDAGPGAAAVAQPARELRPQVDGLQQRELRAHRVPGDEPRLRGPRLLLRRPVLPACRAARGPAVEGVRQGARRHDPHGSQRRRCGPGRPLPLPGRDEPVRGPAREAAARGARAGACGAVGAGARAVPRGLPQRHDHGGVGRRRGLARRGDSERRLGPGHHRRRAPASA